MSLLDGLASTGLFRSKTRRPGWGPAVQQDHDESGDAKRVSVGSSSLRYGVLNGGNRPVTDDQAGLGCLSESSAFFTRKKDGKADANDRRSLHRSGARAFHGLRRNRDAAMPWLPCCLPNTFSFERRCNCVQHRVAVTRFHLDSQNNVSTAAA
ncbi:hypothetical protein ABZP36_024119 [Zizania latifolia]